jgi:hypothetical protein
MRIGKMEQSAKPAAEAAFFVGKPGKIRAADLLTAAAQMIKPLARSKKLTFRF